MGNYITLIGQLVTSIWDMKMYMFQFITIGLMYMHIVHWVLSLSFKLPADLIFTLVTNLWLSEQIL